MDEKYIERFNKARSFLYVSGYLTESENDKVIKRFKKRAKQKGIELYSKSMLEVEINGK